MSTWSNQCLNPSVCGVKKHTKQSSWMQCLAKNGGDKGRVGSQSVVPKANQQPKNQGQRVRAEIQKAIREQSPGDALYLARKYPGVDTRALEDVVLSGQDDVLKVAFARHVEGADIERIERYIGDSGNIGCINDFAYHVPGANAAYLQKQVLRNHTARDVLIFAIMDHEGADVSKLEQKVIDSGEKDVMLEFAEKVPGANKKKLNQAIEAIIQEEQHPRNSYHDEAHFYQFPIEGIKTKLNQALSHRQLDDEKSHREAILLVGRATKLAKRGESDQAIIESCTDLIQEQRGGGDWRDIQNALQQIFDL